MVLGGLVLAIAAFLVFSYFRNLKIGQTLNNGANNNVAQETYTVAKGDSLWKISEKYYGNGYKWQKIAEANALANTNQIEEGMQLAIPTLEEKSTTQEIKVSDTTPGPKDFSGVDSAKAIDGSSYTVAIGDSLWSIAVRAYGDGYKWVNIAKANNLSHPDIIHSGNQLTLPR